MSRNTLSLIIATLALIMAPAIAFSQAGEWQAGTDGKPQKVASAPGEKEIGQPADTSTPAPGTQPPPANGGGSQQPPPAAGGGTPGTTQPSIVDKSLDWASENWMWLIGGLVVFLILFFVARKIFGNSGHGHQDHGHSDHHAHPPAPHGGGHGHGHPPAAPAPHGPGHTVPVAPPPPAPAPAPVPTATHPPAAPPPAPAVNPKVNSVSFSAPSTIQSGKSHMFRANVDATVGASTDVKWTASAGSINVGRFTAPTVTVPTNVTITATSVADATKSHSETISVVPVPAPSAATTTPVIAVIGMIFMSLFGAAPQAKAAGLCDAVSVSSAFPRAAVPGKDTSSLVQGSNLSSVVGVNVMVPNVGAAIVSKSGNQMMLRISAGASAAVLNRGSIVVRCSDGSTKELDHKFKVMVMTAEQYAIAQGAEHVVESFGASAPAVTTTRTVHVTDAATKTKLGNVESRLTKAEADIKRLDGWYPTLEDFQREVEKDPARFRAILAAYMPAGSGTSVVSGGVDERRVEQIATSVFSREIVPVTRGIEEVRKVSDQALAHSGANRVMIDANIQATHGLLQAASRGKKLSKKSANELGKNLNCAEHLARTGVVKEGCLAPGKPAK